MEYHPPIKSNPFMGVNGTPLFGGDKAIDKKRAATVWKLATRFGDANATTRFDEHKPLETDTYATAMAKRPYFLGYLTKIRFTKFCQSTEGSEVTGVDCTKSGVGGSGREGDIRRVCNLFFELCVAYSKHCEQEEDDYERVRQARGLSEDGFTTYQGLAACLYSGELDHYRKEWAEMGLSAVVVEPAAATEPPAPATEPAAPATEPPAPATEPPAPKRKKRTKAVVDIDGDSSGDELLNESVYSSPKQPPAPSPEPAPAPKVPEGRFMGQAADGRWVEISSEQFYAAAAAPAPKKPKKPKKPKPQHKRDRNPSARGSAVSDDTSHWPAGCLGAQVLKAFEETRLRAQASALVFTDNNHKGAKFDGGYAILIKRRTGGVSAGGVDGYVILSGMAKERDGASQLRSTKEIARHFNANPDLNSLPA